METAARTPLHLWIVGVVATLWNAFGCFDYLMTETRNAAYLAQLTEGQRAWIDAFPAWSEGAWACGVWGGLLGSLLLLARSRWAVPAFILSLAGLAVVTVYQRALSAMPAGFDTPAMWGMTAAIWAVAIFLLFYAVAMRGRGVLR
jgi:hypothetical protein